MQEEAIIFTDAAANKVGALLQDEENNAMNLRVYVTGGGCAGFQYGFSFDESKDESDTMLEKNGVKLTFSLFFFSFSLLDQGVTVLIQ